MPKATEQLSHGFPHSQLVGVALCDLVLAQARASCSLVFFGTVVRICLGRDSARRSLCAKFWLFVIVRTCIRTQVEGGLSWSHVFFSRLFSRSFFESAKTRRKKERKKEVKEGKEKNMFANISYFYFSPDPLLASSLQRNSPRTASASAARA